MFLAGTGIHIPTVPPLPLLGWWLGSIGEAGNCGKLKGRVQRGGQQRHEHACLKTSGRVGQAEINALWLEKKEMEKKTADGLPSGKEHV